MTDTQETLAECIARLGLTVSAEFVPFSQSRNAKPDARPGERSLNWRVTLKHNGRDVLTTDYSAGIGHCPAYKASARRLGNANSLLRAQFIEWETENGKESHTNEFQRPYGIKPILPDSSDVIYSLVSDSDVLDCSTFEEWAGNLGYDPDSRKAEAIYRACLEIALKLRNSIGDAELSALREAAQDY